MFVKANALADEDPEFAVKARNAFSALETFGRCAESSQSRNYKRII